MRHIMLSMVLSIYVRLRVDYVPKFPRTSFVCRVESWVVATCCNSAFAPCQGVARIWGGWLWTLRWPPFAWRPHGPLRPPGMPTSRTGDRGLQLTGQDINRLSQKVGTIWIMQMYNRHRCMMMYELICILHHSTWVCKICDIVCAWHWIHQWSLQIVM